MLRVLFLFPCLSIKFYFAQPKSGSFWTKTTYFGTPLVVLTNISQVRRARTLKDAPPRGYISRERVCVRAYKNFASDPCFSNVTEGIELRNVSACILARSQSTHRRSESAYPGPRNILVFSNRLENLLVWPPQTTKFNGWSENDQSVCGYS